MNKLLIIAAFYFLPLCLDARPIELFCKERISTYDIFAEYDSDKPEPDRYNKEKVFRHQKFINPDIHKMCMESWHYVSFKLETDDLDRETEKQSSGTYMYDCLDIPQKVIYTLSTTPENILFDSTNSYSRDYVISRSSLTFAKIFTHGRETIFECEIKEINILKNQL